MKKIVFNSFMLILTVLVSVTLYTSCNKKKPDIEVDNSGNNNDSTNTDNDDSDTGDNDSTDVDPVYEVTLDSANLAFEKNVQNESSGDGSKLTDGISETYWEPESSDISDEEVSFVIDLGSTQQFNGIDQYWIEGNENIKGFKVEYNFKDDPDVSDNNWWEMIYEYPYGTIGSDTLKTVFAYPFKKRYIRITYQTKSSNKIKLGEIVVRNNENAIYPINLSLNGSIAATSSSCGGTCGGDVEHLIDGDLNTFWQPLGSDRKDDAMVWATIDLGETQIFNALNVKWKEGHQGVGPHEVLYSDDNKNWESAYNDLNRISGGITMDVFPKVTARYIKVEFHLRDTNVTEKVSEIEVYNFLENN